MGPSYGTRCQVFSRITSHPDIRQLLIFFFRQGMAAVVKEMGIQQVILHNRYFDSQNDYLGKFQFIVEKDIAVPMEEGLFLYIMSQAMQWGMVVYEQDWLIYSYLNVTEMQSNVTNARTWLLSMESAAR